LKIVKKTKKVRSVTLRIADATMNKIDSISKKNGISRQLLIERILETAIDSPDFEIEVSTSEDI
jgi:predicted DNA binding CopG/RHH family protein